MPSPSLAVAARAIVAGALYVLPLAGPVRVTVGGRFVDAAMVAMVAVVVVVAVAPPLSVWSRTAGRTRDPAGGRRSTKNFAGSSYGWPAKIRGGVTSAVSAS